MDGESLPQCVRLRRVFLRLGVQLQYWSWYGIGVQIAAGVPKDGDVFVSVLKGMDGSLLFRDSDL